MTPELWAVICYLLTIFISLWYLCVIPQPRKNIFPWGNISDINFRWLYSPPFSLYLLLDTKEEVLTSTNAFKTATFWSLRAVHYPRMLFQGISKSVIKHGLATPISASSRFLWLKFQLLSKLQRCQKSNWAMKYCKLLLRDFRKSSVRKDSGNEIPTDLLHRIKEILGWRAWRLCQDNISTAFLPKRLPSTAQLGLFTARGKLTTDELAKLAEEFVASFPAHRSVSCF